MVPPQIPTRTDVEAPADRVDQLLRRGETALLALTLVCAFDLAMLAPQMVESAMPSLAATATLAARLTTSASLTFAPLLALHVALGGLHWAAARRPGLWARRAAAALGLLLVAQVYRLDSSAGVGEGSAPLLVLLAASALWVVFAELQQLPTRHPGRSRIRAFWIGGFLLTALTSRAGYRPTAAAHGLELGLAGLAFLFLQPALSFLLQDSRRVRWPLRTALVGWGMLCVVGLLPVGDKPSDGQLAPLLDAAVLGSRELRAVSHSAMAPHRTNRQGTAPMQWRLDPTPSNRPCLVQDEATATAPRGARAATSA